MSPINKISPFALSNCLKEAKTFLRVSTVGGSAIALLGGIGLLSEAAKNNDRPQNNEDRVVTSSNNAYFFYSCIGGGTVLASLAGVGLLGIRKIEKNLKDTQKEEESRNPNDGTQASLDYSQKHTELKYARGLHRLSVVEAILKQKQ